MFYLIVAALLLALTFVGWRYRRLKARLRHLLDALLERRPYVDGAGEFENIALPLGALASTCNSLIQQINRLEHQRAGHLAQLETTLGNLQEAVLIVDRSNYVLLANRATRRIFPNARNILGQRLEGILRSADFFNYLDEVRTRGANVSREIEFVETDRSTWVEATGAVIPENQEQSAPWTLFVLHDITKQKRLEAVRRDFVANVSHELKTPLSVIRGYAETLVDAGSEMEAADREQFTRTIHRHACRLAAIVDDLLTLSRLESAPTAIQPSLQKVGEFLSSIAAEFSQRVVENGRFLVLAVESPETMVRFDSLRLSQVFGNFLDNAEKYTPPGSTIELGAKLLPEAAAVEFWVRDNGAGIPAHDLPRIFERFYRVEKGRSREAGGTGLGLSIVKHIVQLHGGSVWAESELGKGTRFAFTLPLGSNESRASSDLRIAEAR